MDSRLVDGRFVDVRLEEDPLVEVFGLVDVFDEVDACAPPSLFLFDDAFEESFAAFSLRTELSVLLFMLAEASSLGLSFVDTFFTSDEVDMFAKILPTKSNSPITATVNMNDNDNSKFFEVKNPRLLGIIRDVYTTEIGSSYTPIVLSSFSLLLCKRV